MQYKKSTSLLVALALLMMIFSGCSNFPTYPANGPCTFTIPEPAGFDCYTKHRGTTKIKLVVNVISRSYDTRNRKYTFFADKTISVDPVATSFPVSLTMDVPVSGPYEVEFNILGEECSECANGASDPKETPYGDCKEIPANTTTNPWTSRAARPRWNGTIPYSSYVSIATVPATPRTTNVPNSCGCTVSW